MNLQDLIGKMQRSIDFNGTLDDMSDEELNMMANLMIFEMQDRDMSKMKSVMGDSPT
jgi:hypothetical protein